MASHQIVGSTLTVPLDPPVRPEADNAVTALAPADGWQNTRRWNFYEYWRVSRHRLARLNPDGTLDSGFTPEPNNQVSSLALQTDGKILVGGNFTVAGGQPRNRIARLFAMAHWNCV